MPTFVQIEPDAFNVVAGAVSQIQKGVALDPDTNSGFMSVYDHVRRPVRGIQIKSEKYATIQVRRSNGSQIPLFDAASPSYEDGGLGKSVRNSNFLIQSIQEQRAEKQQIVLTFGTPYIFFFDEQPRILNISGILLNTEDFNWRAEWWENYENYLRGTRCVQARARVYLSWDDIVVEGYIMSSGAQEDASNTNLVQFNFQMFLTNYHNISSIGLPYLPSTAIDLEAEVDILGLNQIGAQQSSTLLVRTQNQGARDRALAEGRGKNSIINTLRQGQFGNALQDASERLFELRGQVVDFLDVAGRFVSGRNIRVPIGFEGSAVFDQEVQIALASVPGATEIINGSGDRVVRLFTGLRTEFTANLFRRFGPARTGLTLSANEDEFIARGMGGQTGRVSVPQLFTEQLSKDIEAADHVRDVFEEFGIDLEPPSDLTLMFRRSMFGITSVAAGMLLSRAPEVTSTINLAGTIL